MYAKERWNKFILLSEDKTFRIREDKEIFYG